MDVKGKIFKTLIGQLSISFLLLSTILFVIGELVYSLKVGGNTIYFSIFFIAMVLISTVIYFFLLRKPEDKTVLYIVFTLPVIVFCVFRFIDLFAAPNDYIVEIILLLPSILLAVALIVVAFFISEERVIIDSDKKRRKIVESVTDTQDKYRKALERKRAEMENVIEEE